MKYLLKILITATIFFSIFLMAPTEYGWSSKPYFYDGKDSTNITFVQFTVLGLDSASIGWVQDRLDTITGVTFNFACWADTVIFIEYDSLLTNQARLKEAIKKLGYDPRVREP
jgi:hypothetical protein